MGTNIYNAETGKEEYFDGTPIPSEKIFYPALSGRSKRKLDRAKTIHLRGICPQCGKTNMKFYKKLYIKGSEVKTNKWYCQRCGKTASREELKYVKYGV